MVVDIYIYMISDQGTTMRWEKVYTPNGSGTVLSPDNYLFNQPDEIFEFQQSGNKDCSGNISFLDKNCRIIESINLKRNNNGQWLTTMANPILLPSTATIYTIRQVQTRSQRQREATSTEILVQQNDDEIETIQKDVLTDNNNNNNDQQHSKHVTINLNDETIEREATPNLPNTKKNYKRPQTKPVQDIELWHQRMRHISPRTLQKTQHCTTGIPPITKTMTLFKCPFCEKAKMFKRSGLQKQQDACIPGQVFHMDLSYVSGPSNLDDILTYNAPPEPSLKRSRDGYIGFLTIIDVASRYIWTHSVKSKDPPLDYIDRFLKKHGIQTTDPNKALKVTMTKNGYLAKSRAFKSTVGQSDFEVHPTDCNFINTLMPDQVDAYIQTDGGGELSHSHAFRTTVDHHGYDVTTTAADAPHQNGIVEQPHRTLKERIRCMLYAARLGVEYWADALQQATWLYNRTYHSAIDMTPLQAYSGQVPSIDSRITFGTKITAKKSGQRPNILNPWTYDGIFLGYQNTMHNIRYWDVRYNKNSNTRFKR